MRKSALIVFATTAALSACAPTGEAERKPIPVMSLAQAESLPPDKLPTMFRDPSPYLHYPYNVHETDGLSRNPDDCVRWGCIDNTNR